MAGPAAVAGDVDDVTSRRRANRSGASDDDFTRFDGNLEGLEGLTDSGWASGDVPTTLENYAACPHAFFIERMLSIRPLETPETSSRSGRTNSGPSCTGHGRAHRGRVAARRWRTVERRAPQSVQDIAEDMAPL